MGERKIQYKQLTHNQKTMLQRRGMDPRNFVVIKDTYTSLYLRDVRDGTVRILFKFN